MIATVESKQRAVRFPEAEVRAALIKFWAKEALQRADDPFARTLKTAGTLYELLPALDSLTIVCGFLLIEKILEVQVPVGLVKAGGYRSEEEMLKDLLPKLRKFYEKRQN